MNRARDYLLAALVVPALILLVGIYYLEYAVRSAFGALPPDEF